MWIMMSNALLSIAADMGNGANLCVCARLRGDIERIFPDAIVTPTPRDADCAFRTSLPRSRVMGAIAGVLLEIEYSDFFVSVSGQPRLDAYRECAGAMNYLQRRQQDQDRMASQVADIFKRPTGKRNKRVPTPIEDISRWPLEVRR